MASVGAASLWWDTSHELVTSLLPSFVTSTLHAGPAALGVIEGVSDALAGFSKLVGGPLANDPRRRGRLAAAGYVGTAVATAAIGLTTAVWQVAALRATAQSTAVAHALPDELRGKGFRVLGLTQAFGDLGSTVVAGLLWSVLSPTIAFGYAAAWMAAAIVTAGLLRGRRPRSSPRRRGATATIRWGMTWLGGVGLVVGPTGHTET